jgi:hypothetical protein
LDRDKSVLSIYRLKGESLEESDNLSDPSVLIQEIVVPRLASLGRPRARARAKPWTVSRGALEQFREIAAQEMAARMLELAEIRNGDVLGKNRVCHRHGRKP